MIATDSEPFSFVGLLNANYADGIDTSWIWDGNFEKLPALNISFHYWWRTLQGHHLPFEGRWCAGWQACSSPELKDVVEKIKTLPTEHVYVLATYTAVLQLRKLLADQGYIKEGMGAWPTN